MMAGESGPWLIKWKEGEEGEEHEAKKKRGKKSVEASSPLSTGDVK